MGIWTMISCSQIALAAALLVTCLACPSWAASPADETPEPYQPLHPTSKKDKDRRESLKQYALGLLCLKEDRMVEALQAFEKAVQLDPEAPEVYKALIPLYAELRQTREALAACKRVLDLDPADAETWYHYSRILQSQGKVKEARTALQKGLKFVSTEKQPGLAEQMYFDLGMLQVEDKEPVAAARSFARCVRLLEINLATESLEPAQRQEASQKAASLYDRIGKAYVDARKYSQAHEAYRKAQKVFPEGAGRWNLPLAQIATAEKKWRSALDYANAYLVLQPQGLQAYELKIELLDRLDRANEILPWLEKASTRDHFNVGLCMLLARQYACRGQLARAEDIYQKLGEDNPQPEIYSKLFKLYRKTPGAGMPRVLAVMDRNLAAMRGPEPAAARAKGQARAMVDAVRRDKELTGELLKTGLSRLGEADRLQPDTVQLLATLAEDGEQLQAAEKYYRACMKDLNAESESPAYAGLLRTLWRAKKYQEVVTICRDGLRKSKWTNHVIFHSELARALARLKKTEDALKEADLAVRLATDNSRLGMVGLRIRILAQAERYAQAEKECLKLLDEFKLPADLLEVRYLLSYVYTATRNFPKAEEQLQLILKADPANATACNDLGYLWADQGKNLAEAEKLIRKALDLEREQRQGLVGTAKEGAVASKADEGNAAYVDSLGWVLFRKGEVQEARTVLEKATKLPGGEDPVIWDHLGDVYFRLHQPLRARRCWEKALQLYEEDGLRSRDQHYRDLKEKLSELQTAQP
jgi:tetratricopeptide (TPR) repeat protein